MGWFGKKKPETDTQTAPEVLAIRDLMRFFQGRGTSVPVAIRYSAVFACLLVLCAGFPAWTPINSPAHYECGISSEADGNDQEPGRWRACPNGAPKETVIRFVGQSYGNPVLSSPRSVKLSCKTLS